MGFHFDLHAVLYNEHELFLYYKLNGPGADRDWLFKGGSMAQVPCIHLALPAPCANLPEHDL